MAREFDNLAKPTLLFCREVMTRIKRLEDLVALMGGASFTFRNQTAEADPGSGNFRINNSSKAASTAMFVSELTAGNINVEDLYEEVDPGDHFIIFQEDDPGRNLHVTVTALTDNSTWFDIDYTVDAANGAEFQNNRLCSLSLIKQ